MSYFSKLKAALTLFGVNLDETENVILDGQQKQTISMRCALALKAKKTWGIVTCVFLSLLIQWRHCLKQLHNIPMNWNNYIRAFVWLTFPVWFAFSLIAFGLKISAIGTLIVIVLCIIMSGFEAFGLL